MVQEIIDFASNDENYHWWQELSSVNDWKIKGSYVLFFCSLSEFIKGFCILFLVNTSPSIVTLNPRNFVFMESSLSKCLNSLQIDNLLLCCWAFLEGIIPGIAFYAYFGIFKKQVTCFLKLLRFVLSTL